MSASKQFHNDKRWGLVYLCISVMFAGTGVLAIISGKTITGLVIVFFFASCGLAFLYQLLDSRPRIVMDSDGITDSTLGVGKILWSDIDAAFLSRLSGASFIQLVISESTTRSYQSRLSETKKRLSRANRAIGYPQLNINLTGINGKPAAIYACFIDYHQTATSADDTGTYPSG